MFFSSEERAEWYLSRGLAKKNGEKEIQFTFVPKGHGLANDRCMQISWKNKCVVCGSEDVERLTRHHVVPYCYRKHFPEKYKARNHYDVLPICRECHNTYEHNFADSLKSLISEIYDAPLTGRMDDAYQDKLAATQAALALSLHSSKMPEDRKSELLQVVQSHLGKEPNKEDIFQLAEQDKREMESLRMTHGQIVVESMTEEELGMFIKRWRKHFLRNMRPRHMPEGWVVEK
jgi:hypothetical protein